MRSVVRSLFVLTSLVAFAHAQKRVLVVDAANGPFRDLPAAVAAARSGDVLSILPGRYSGFRTSKALSLIGGPRVVIAGSYTARGIEIHKLPAGSVFSVSNVRIEGGIWAALQCDDCRGTIELEDVHITTTGVVLRRCTDVRLTTCHALALNINQTAAVLDRCKLVGKPHPTFPLPAISAFGSSLTISRCDVAGVDSVWQLNNTVAIHASRSILILTGDGTGQVRAGSGRDRAAIEGSGVVVIDSRVRVRATGKSRAISTNYQVVQRSIPSLRVENAKIGQTVFGNLVGQPGDAFVLAVGYPTAPHFVPSVLGMSWIRDAVVTNVGKFGKPAWTFWRAKVPNDVRLVGETFVWQALSGNTLQGYALSNPGSYTHSFR